MSMFRESPIKYRSASSSFNGFQGMKMMNSTSSSFGNNQMRVGSSGSGGFSMRRNSMTIKNTQGRLDTLKDSLGYLTQDVIDARNTTKQASLYLKFMREDLQDRQLLEIEGDLKHQISALKKLVNIGIRSDKLRYESAWQNVSLLQKNNRSIQRDLYTISDALSRVENSLGFYNGAQKHKF